MRRVSAKELATPMTDTPPEYDARQPGSPGLEHLMKIKALSQERLAFQKGAWRAEYEALSPAEKARVDAKFKKISGIIAAQFGRSRPFMFEGPDKLAPTQSDRDRSSEPN